MRVIPNRLRLRIIALCCFALGVVCGVYNQRIVALNLGAPVLVVGLSLLGLLLVSVGIAFLLLSTDRHAEVRFDTRGLLLNLGHSSAFVAWEHVECIGVTRHRSSLWALGSSTQLGIALRDVAPYVQSYEERLPSSRGPIGYAMQGVAWALRPFRRANDEPLTAQLTRNRAKTGYNILVPEIFLGTKPQAFIHVLDAYRLQLPPQRATWSSALVG